MQQQKLFSRNKLHFLVGIVTLIAGIVLPIFSYNNDAHAAQITNRSLTLQAGATDGGSMAGGTVNHLFDFDVVGGTDIASIKFEYCTTAAPVVDGIDCDLPTGLDTTTVTLGSESGATGFDTIDTSTNGTVIISKAAAAAATGTLSYRLDGVVNPTNVNETFFVRLSTHNANDGTGPDVDSGTVTASTTQQIELDGTMPESLVFCTGEEINTTGGVPDCGTATAGTVSFDRLFSPTDTAIATSEMAASTNAGLGYAITINGPTLTSGGNTIDPMDNGSGGATTGVRGLSQFGLNLVANTTDTSTPAVGTEVSPIFGSANYNGQPATDYDTVDNFKFASGDVIANSGSTSTDAQIFTTSYVVNVPGSQPAGTYTSTLTYICTATF